MKEQEAMFIIQNAMEQSRKALAELILLTPKVFKVRAEKLGEYYSNLENCKKEIEACEIAIKALEEIQQYRAIEKALKENYQADVCIKMLMQYFIETIFKGEKHERFCILTNEDAEKWDAYKAIGTPEECRAAVEKQRAKKPTIINNGIMLNFKCPRCGIERIVGRNAREDYCGECGQLWDWSDEE
ncbi:MAG: hypothetical protein PUJ55_09865 [Clostridiales bacterium]|nr:hypothetical protein [Clostridiales bacterium]MDY4113122.1 hypothetical protein [Roseburia sp.]